MKITIVGAGAMELGVRRDSREGRDEVWALDVWVEHVDAINRGGERAPTCSASRS